MEWASILGALAGATAAGITILTFWMTLSGRITKAETDAIDAKRSVAEANDKIALTSAAFALYREQVASQYIHREVMREVEDRLTAAIERLGDRLDRILERDK